MKVSREVVGAESVVVVTRPVQLPGCFLLVWLLVWSPGVVLAAHHFLTAETMFRTAVWLAGMVAGLDSHDDAFVHLVPCLMGSPSLVLWQERDSAWGEVGRVLHRRRAVWMQEAFPRRAGIEAPH